MYFLCYHISVYMYIFKIEIVWRGLRGNKHCAKDKKLLRKIVRENCFYIPEIRPFLTYLLPLPNPYNILQDQGIIIKKNQGCYLPLEVSNILQSSLKITLVAQDYYQTMEMILHTTMVVQGIRIQKDLLRCPMKLILNNLLGLYIMIVWATQEY